MTELRKGSSWLERAKASNPSFAAEQSAADVALRASVLLREAWHECELAGVERKDLAAILELDPSRITQVLNSDGNVRLSTLSKFLVVMGYELELGAKPGIEGRKPIGRRKPRRTRADSDQTKSSSSVYVSKIRHEGATTFKWTVFDESFPADHETISGPHLVGQLDPDQEPLKIRTSRFDSKTSTPEPSTVTAARDTWMEIS